MCLRFLDGGTMLGSGYIPLVSPCYSARWLCAAPESEHRSEGVSWRNLSILAFIPRLIQATTIHCRGRTRRPFQASGRPYYMIWNQQSRIQFREYYSSRLSFWQYLCQERFFILVYLAILLFISVPMSLWSALHWTHGIVMPTNQWVMIDDPECSISFY